MERGLARAGDKARAHRRAPAAGLALVEILRLSANARRMASPTGADSNRLLGWLRAMDALRQTIGNAA
jgi:hypothetical protein